MHLDEIVLVVGGAVDDDEDVVVVLVELRPLAEVLRVLDRERVKPEHVAEERHVSFLGAVEVEPEEGALTEEPVDLSSFDFALDCAALVDEVRSHAT